MGYKVFVGSDGGSDIWTTTVQLAALRESLQTDGVPAAVVACAGVKTPSGTPVQKVVQGDTDEIVAGGISNKFLSIEEVMEQMNGNAAGSTAVPNLVAQTITPSDNGNLLSSDKDYAIVLSCGQGLSPWNGILDLEELRRYVQDATGASIAPSVIMKSSSTPGQEAVTLIECKSQESICSGTSGSDVMSKLAPGIGGVEKSVTTSVKPTDVQPPSAKPVGEGVETSAKSGIESRDLQLPMSTPVSEIPEGKNPAANKHVNEGSEAQTSAPNNGSKFIGVAVAFLVAASAFVMLRRRS